MDTVTIPGVELLRVGTWYGTVDGKAAPVEVTAADLAAAVEAAKDPDVDHAPLKVGHASALLGDGAPALGWLANIRLSGDGRKLIADLTDVPVKFAKLLPKAFRRRSAELAFGLRTPGGRRYRLAVTALSALGVTPPAVKGLADIADLYNLAGEVDAEQVATAQLATGVDTAAALEKLTTALDAIDQLGLDDATRARFAAELEDAAGVTDATIPPPSESSGQTGADAATTDQEAPAVPITDDKLRELIGAAEGDDLEQAIAALKAKAEKAPADDPAGTGEGEGGSGEGAREPVGAGALSDATLAELKAAGAVVISEDLLKELRAPAVELAEARRASILDKAVAAGKISPAERGTFATDDKPATGFAALLTANEEQTVAILDGMAVRYATAELGAANAPDAADDAALEEFERSFLPTAQAAGLDA